MREPAGARDEAAIRWGDGDEMRPLPWVDALLDSWARWGAAGGVALPSAAGSMYVNKGAPPSTAPDGVNAHDLRMLDVDRVVIELRENDPELGRLVRLYYQRDMGRAAVAKHLRVTERTFDARLARAHYHVARLLGRRS